MAYGNGTFVGYGSGFQFVSHDGANWTVYSSPPAISPAVVAYGNGNFLAFGTNAQFKVNYILQSTNGIAWTPIYQSSNTLFAAAYGNNTWVFVAYNEIVTANVTSTNWIWHDYQPSFAPYSVVYGNGVFAIGTFLGNNIAIFSSPDGINWQYKANLPYSSNGTNVLASNASYPFKITFGNGLFVTTESWVNYPNYPNTGGIVYNGAIVVSSNLVNWVPQLTLSSTTNPFIFQPVAFGANEFIAGLQDLQNPKIYTSPDGYSWSYTTSAPNNLSGYSFAYGQGIFELFSEGYQNNSNVGVIYQSNVFASDSNSLAPTTLEISTYPGVTINGTAGAVYQIQSSTDLNAWQTLTNFMLPCSPYIWVDTSSAATGQKFYRSVQLQ